MTAARALSERDANALREGMMFGTSALVIALMFIAPAAVRAETFSALFERAQAAKDKSLEVELYSKALKAWTANDLNSNKAIVLGNRAIVYSDLKQIGRA